jgi:glycosyltransferase involved in cell wall biosynthesis
MKVMLVLDRLHEGGAQAFARDLAVGVAASGTNCRIVAIHAGDNDDADVGVQVHVLAGPPSTRQLLVAILRLWHLCHRERPDILHGHAEVADLASRLVGTFLGIPVISTAHNLRMWNWRPRLGRFIERRTARFSALHIAVSAAVAAVLRETLAVPADRLRVVPNWTPRAHDGQPPAHVMPAKGHPTIVHVARLHPQKRQDILLKAFRHVQTEFPDARLWIIGAGPAESSLRHAAGRGVEFLGHRTDVRDLLRQGDLFVLSSDWEGMPLSILEAMQEGLAVVSTAAGGVAEVVEHEVTGLVVPIGDVSALAQAICTVLRDPNMRQHMGETARQRCEGRRDSGIAAYVRYYNAVLAAPGRQR